MKKLLIGLTSAVMVLLCVACGDKPVEPTEPVEEPEAVEEVEEEYISLKDYAEFYTPLVNESEVIFATIVDEYNKLSTGEITQDDFITKLEEQKEIVMEIRDKSDEFALNNKLSPEDRESEIYQNGIYYGKSINLHVRAYITEATSTNGKIEDLYLDDSDDFESYICYPYFRKAEKFYNGCSQIDGLSYDVTLYDQLCNNK